MIRVLIDARAYGMSGIGRYIEFLLHQLQNSPSIEYTVLALKDNQDSVARALTHSSIEVVTTDITPYSIKEILLGVMFFHRLSKQFDIIHFTHTNAPIVLPKNSFLTIHDIIPLRLPYRKFAKIYLYLFLRINSYRCEHLITVSEYTRQDVIKQFKAFRNKSSTVYTRFTPLLSRASDSHNSLSTRLKALIRSNRYFIYVGNRKPHKNIDFTIRVFDDLMSEFDDIQLVIVGNRFTEHDRVDESLRQVRNSGGFVEISDASDEDLVALYSNAYAGVLFSKYEGFGMPPIEAGLLGTPYIVSNRTSLPEIVDNQLCVVDIDNPEEVRASLRRLLLDDEYYNDLKDHMYNRAQYFLLYESMNKIEDLYLARKTK